MTKFEKYLRDNIYDIDGKTRERIVPRVVRRHEELMMARDTWEEEMYIYSLRYALGRSTYITSVVSEYISSHAEFLSIKCKIVMIRDIKEAEKRDELGHKCDKDSWMSLLDKLT